MQKCRIQQHLKCNYMYVRLGKHHGRRNLALTPINTMQPALVRKISAWESCRSAQGQFLDMFESGFVNAHKSAEAIFVCSLKDCQIYKHSQTPTLRKVQDIGPLLTGLSIRQHHFVRKLFGHGSFSSQTQHTVSIWMANGQRQDAEWFTILNPFTQDAWGRNLQTNPLMQRIYMQCEHYHPWQCFSSFQHLPVLRGVLPVSMEPEGIHLQNELAGDRFGQRFIAANQEERTFFSWLSRNLLQCLQIDCDTTILTIGQCGCLGKNWNRPSLNLSRKAICRRLCFALFDLHGPFLTLLCTFLIILSGARVPGEIGKHSPGFQDWRDWSKLSKFTLVIYPNRMTHTSPRSTLAWLHRHSCNAMLAPMSTLMPEWHRDHSGISNNVHIGHCLWMSECRKCTMLTSTPHTDATFSLWP